MTLPSSGYLSANAIKGEFGGGNPVWISNYYAGGPYVPSGTSGTYGAVPSSGTIWYHQFYGTSNIIPGNVYITNNSFSAGNDWSSVTSVNFGSNGVMWFEGNDGSNYYPSGEWLSSGHASSISVFAQIISQSGNAGTSPAGTFNSWLPLTSNRTWSVAASTSGTSSRSKTATIRFSLARTNALGTILATADKTIQTVAVYPGGP